MIHLMSKQLSGKVVRNNSGITFYSSTDAEEFINLVEQLEASGGADQREPMIAAMRAAAIRCPVRSTIFLFTV